VCRENLREDKKKRKNLEISKKANETRNKKYFNNCENYLNYIVFIYSYFN